MHDNKEQLLALKYLQETNVNIFLTGKAGTGKTTFLKGLKERLYKRFVVLAPTGVAALQAGGVTLHSFFQLPFHIYIPGTKPQTRKFSKEKINLIRSLDLIVIDEISMVRCDVLDEIDYLLRHLRYNSYDKPFGGVQLLMIGDLNQLPPIVTEQEGTELKEYYQSFYFFGAHSLRQSNYITITLTHIYRQRDKKFIDILNAVRDNQITPEIIHTLNSRYKPSTAEHIPEGFIVLCTHNSQADSINNHKIVDLKTDRKVYKAQITGDFPENIYPNKPDLLLKVGAQVMFLKNDYSIQPNHKKRYYNGKIGKIKKLEEEYVIVECPGEEDITVEPYTWENIRYTIDKNSKAITEEITGTFRQLPLRLAWAVTIHKSQGLTFDKVIIDSNRAFSHGQVYVALSRCRSLEGIVLTEKFDMSSVISDWLVRQFTLDQMKFIPNENSLQIARQEFKTECIKSIFDFSQLSLLVNRLSKFANTILIKIFKKQTEKINTFVQNYRADIQDVGEKFGKFISNKAIETENDLSENSAIIMRCLKGREYFLQHLSEFNNLISDLLEIELDNEDDNSELQEITAKLAIEKEIKYRFLNFFTERFDITDYLKFRDDILSEGNALKLNSIGEDRSQKNNDNTSVKEAELSNNNVDVTDNELFTLLRQWRKSKAEEKKLPIYCIISQKALISITNAKPSTLKKLLSLNGIGKKTVENYGMEILDLISDYLNR